MADSKVIAMQGLQGVVDDGTREIPIRNKFGKLICNIYIRPSDFSILDRYTSFRESMASVVEPLKNISIKADGTVDATDEQAWDAIKTAQDALNQRLNELFDMDEAQDIFAKRNPFSSVHGKFFCELVIEAIGEVIVRAVSEETEMSKKRMAKYLDNSEVKNEPRSTTD